MTGESNGTIREARAGELPELNALTRRSVLSWGYDPGILEWGRGDLEITDEVFAASTVRVLDEDGRITGYYALRRHDTDLYLERMFVDAEHIGTGRGKRLWNHAVAAGREQGDSTFLIPPDANAAPFYKAMGATFVKAIATDWPGFGLELLRFDLPDEETP